jgi:hypothetical protein
MASLWTDLDAQDTVRRVNGDCCRLRLPTVHAAAEQLPSSGGATEREEEGGQLAAEREEERRRRRSDEPGRGSDLTCAAAAI